MDLPLKPRKKVTPSRGRLSAGGLFVFTCPYRFCRIRSSAYKRIYKVGNRLCEKNLHVYFNFALPTPYSHGVRRQQTDRMFPCKEKIYLLQKGECVMKKTLLLKKLTAMAATLAMTCVMAVGAFAAEPTNDFFTPTGEILYQ